jgi:hypothetical protein
MEDHPDSLRLLTFPREKLQVPRSLPVIEFKAYKNRSKALHKTKICNQARY